MHVLFIATGLLAGLATAVPSHYGGSAPDTQSVIAARQMPPCPVGMICLPLYHGIPHPKEPETNNGTANGTIVANTTANGTVNGTMTANTTATAEGLKTAVEKLKTTGKQLGKEFKSVWEKIKDIFVKIGKTFKEAFVGKKTDANAAKDAAAGNATAADNTTRVDAGANLGGPAVLN